MKKTKIKEKLNKTEFTVVKFSYLSFRYSEVFDNSGERVFCYLYIIITIISIKFKRKRRIKVKKIYRIMIWNKWYIIDFVKTTLNEVQSVILVIYY